MSLFAWLNRHADARDHGRAVGGLLVALWLALALLLLALVGVAVAHEAKDRGGHSLGWTYPLSCCSLKDCRPAAQGEVRETLDGYRLTTTGETVPYGDRRIRESPSGDFHVCQQGGDFDHGRILCLFAPGRGF